MIRETYSSEETFKLGESLGRKAGPGQIYTLIGDLGTGKTVFTQGFANGMGVKEYVNSPTFTILKVYEDGRLPLYHFDVYRIEEPEEMEEIGYEDYFFGDGVTLIEWADIIGELIPEDAVRIEISKDLSKGADYRRINVEQGDGSPVHL
ncbi:MAG TPA: tRNA (adenosine(37)-N6)-threonylcarbamoyltransferase complex ATPase subunit type 1 TsaE [Lachnospiraceae bacterium]|nr:tRNA (adenosine(37)-N6)-threonylcarbamoyltransferase complex ATPase subunit type 1 TsaE [Lachnospiraceae bacterium]